MSVASGFELAKSDVIAALRAAPTQIDWLTVKFKYLTRQVERPGLKAALSRILGVPFTKESEGETYSIWSCPEAGLWVSASAETGLTIQFQGTFFAFSVSPLDEIRTHLRRISDLVGEPYHFTRLDISRDFYGVDIERITRSVMKPGTESNLGTLQITYARRNHTVPETLQFKTTKRTIQLYRKDVQMLAQKEGTEYYAEYEARHRAATGKELGSAPWTRLELRICDSAALMPFVRWFGDSEIGYAELLSNALGHYFSKLYIKPDRGDSNISRRKECSYWLAMTRKNKEKTWVSVMGAVRRADLRFSPLKESAEAAFVQAVKKCARQDLDLNALGSRVLQIGIDSLRPFEMVAPESPWARYKDTYRMLVSLQASQPSEQRTLSLQ